MKYYRHKLKKLLVKSGYYSKPSFLILGAQKAGTTLLYSYLANHPQIKRPAFKEAHFFDRDENFQKGKVQYFKNFELPFKFSSGEVTFEATPDYLYFEKCSKRIFEMLGGNIKLIICLRDPVKRAYSAWNMHHHHFLNHSRHSNLYDSRSFREAIEQELQNLNNQDDIYSYVSKGIYAPQIERFVKLFSKDQILIVDNEDLKCQIESSLNGITDFLQLERFDLNNVVKDDQFWDNTGQYKEKPDSDIMEQLNGFYKKYDKQLVELTGRKYSWMS